MALFTYDQHGNYWTVNQAAIEIGQRKEQDEARERREHYKQVRDAAYEYHAARRAARRAERRARRGQPRNRSWTVPRDSLRVRPLLSVLAVAFLLFAVVLARSLSVIDQTELMTLRLVVGTVGCALTAGAGWWVWRRQSTAGGRGPRMLEHHLWNCDSRHWPSR